MSSRVSCRARRRATAALLAFLFAACADAPDFVEPEESGFAALALDRATLRPRVGEQLTVGPAPNELAFDVAWQNLPANDELSVYLQTWIGEPGAGSWEGDLLVASTPLATPSGDAHFGDDFVLADLSPFCGGYDHVRLLVVAPSASGDTSAAPYRDAVSWQVSGAELAAPCLVHARDLFAGDTYRVGEPLLLYGRKLPDAIEVSLPGARQSDNVWPRFIPIPGNPTSHGLLPVADDGYAIAFVPVGAEGGRLRVFAGGAEIRYGSSGDTTLTVAASSADVFEPNDEPALASDSIFFNLWDPFAFWGAYGFNPSLTLAGPDFTPDPVDAEFGVGDWFVVYQPFADIGVTLDLCVNVSAHEGFDIDLYVYDDEGGIVASGGGTEASDEGARVENVGNDDFYYAWVTPFLPNTSGGTVGYTYEVGVCAGAAGSAIERPTGPLGFRFDDPS